MAFLAKARHETIQRRQEPNRRVLGPQERKISDEPEPISDFYVAVISNDEVVLYLGDQKHDAFRRTGSRPSIFDAILICKKEHVFGKRRFTRRARLDGKGKLDNEICVEINEGLVDSDMVIKIDGNVGVEIKHLQWKFRGHDCVDVEKRLGVEVYWDVHDWLFSSSNGLRHALFIFKPMSSSSSLSSSSLPSPFFFEWFYIVVSVSIRTEIKDELRIDQKILSIT